MALRFRGCSCACVCDTRHAYKSCPFDECRTAAATGWATDVGAAATDYLRVCGHLVFAYFWARMAKIALAKLSGILLMIPTTNIQIEGHTDSTGTPEARCTKFPSASPMRIRRLKT